MRHVLAHLLALSLFACASVAAANVSVAVKGGGLAIKGDDAGSTITLDGIGLGSDSVRVTPAGGTTVNGASGPEVFSGLAGGGAKIVLGNGPDVVVIQAVTLVGKITVKTGGGEDSLAFFDAHMQGPTKLDVGSGDNAVRMCASLFEGDTSVKLGKGRGVGASLSPNCGMSGSGADTPLGSVVVVDQSVFDGRFDVKSAAASHVVVQNATPAGGAVSMKNVGVVAFCYGSVDGSLTLKTANVGVTGLNGSCTGGASEAFASGRTAIAMAGAAIEGALTVKQSPGGDATVVTGSSVGVGATVSFGSGNNFLFLDDVQIGESLVAKGGKENDDAFITNTSIGESATIKYGDGANEISLTANTLVGENLTVKTGKGDDVADLSGVSVGGTSKVDLGKGTNTLTTP